MVIPLLGDSGRSTFNRSFFNVRLDELVRKAGSNEHARVTLFLSDGLRIELCHIDELADEYMVVRAHAGDAPECDLDMHVIPYPLIYRISIDPNGPDEPRMGFHFRKAD